jgi:hypothetical protein
MFKIKYILLVFNIIFIFQQALNKHIKQDAIFIISFKIPRHHQTKETL